MPQENWNYIYKRLDLFNSIWSNGKLLAMSKRAILEKYVFVYAYVYAATVENIDNGNVYQQLRQPDQC